MATTVLIVDDDPVQRRLLAHAVEKLGYRGIVAATGKEALALLAAPEGEAVALVILDLVVPGLDGMAVLARLRDRQRSLPVIVQTAQGGIDTVVAAMRAGAADFVVKPVSVERLQVSIENVLRLGALEGELQRLRRSAKGTLTFADIVTRSPAMERVIALAKRAAQSQIPILVEGESGVGKELIARAIQGSGDRKQKPFVTVNCGAVPATLVESILFGHEKGAFTGAQDRHIGKFREADRGTLFLDEVGELTPEVQVKLLRALQDGEIDPVGARRPVRVDFRLISATNKSLIDLVKQGRFREDLYYRLNVFPIRMPPLRERREDIAELVRHFAARFAAEEGKPFVRGVTAEALDLLQRYDWPGNVRQLENAVFRAVVLCDGAWLTPSEFPHVAPHGVHPAAHARAADTAAGGATRGAAVPPPVAPPWPSRSEAVEIAATSADLSPSGHGFAFDESGDILPLAAVEAEMIRLAIARYDGRMTLVARKLGIGRSTLYRKLKELGLDAGVTEDIAAA